jgi:hypothetical protein
LLDYGRALCGEGKMNWLVRRIQRDEIEIKVFRLVRELTSIVAAAVLFIIITYNTFIF